MSQMKKLVRKELIELRKKTSKRDVLEKSNIIKNKLFQLPEYKQSSTILFYVSYGNEVFTHNMIKESMKAGKIVVVPKSDTENRRLILSELSNWNDLEKGSHGILEPKKINEIFINKIDLVIIPGVGFDKNGNRIGHGKGYYDNLIGSSKNILPIGLAFEFQIVEKIPINSYDFPVQKIITEKRVISCK